MATKTIVIQIRGTQYIVVFIATGINSPRHFHFVALVVVVSSSLEAIAGKQVTKGVILDHQLLRRKQHHWWAD